MPLQPLQSDVTPQPSQGDAAADRPASFRERKMAQLHDEPQPEPGRRETRAESDDDPDEGYPDDSLQDDEGHASDAESDDQGALAELTPEYEDDAASDDDTPDTELSFDELNDKYRSLQQEFSRVTAHRKKLEQDFSDGIADNISYRHQLEDLTTQAARRAEFFLGLANQQVAQLENIDWKQVPPERMAQAKQQYQRAVQQRDQLQLMFQQSSEEAKRSVETVKQREAEISRNVLSRRIPEWSDDHYGKLRDHAGSLGYSAAEFNEITDWRIIDLIHQNWQSKEAVETVQQVKRKRKARVPRNRNARPQPRNADGRYRQSRDDAFERPGDKQSFREMKMRQMERERKAGR